MVIVADALTDCRPSVGEQQPSAGFVLRTSDRATMTLSHPVNTRRESRPTLSLRARLDADRRPWRVILVVLAAAAVAAWTFGFLAGLLVIWFGPR
jgi:anti-sigma-K factor RskA